MEGERGSFASDLARTVMTLLRNGLIDALRPHIHTDATEANALQQNPRLLRDLKFYQAGMAQLFSLARSERKVVATLCFDMLPALSYPSTSTPQYFISHPWLAYDSLQRTLSLPGPHETIQDFVTLFVADALMFTFQTYDGTLPEFEKVVVSWAMFYFQRLTKYKDVASLPPLQQEILWRWADILHYVTPWAAGIVLERVELVLHSTVVTDRASLNNVPIIINGLSKIRLEPVTEEIGWQLEALAAKLFVFAAFTLSITTSHTALNEAYMQLFTNFLSQRYVTHLITTIVSTPVGEVANQLVPSSPLYALRSQFFDTIVSLFKSHKRLSSFRSELRDFHPIYNVNPRKPVAAISSSNFHRQLVMHGATSGAPSLRTSTAMFRELDSHENLASIDQSAFHGASQMAMTFGSPIGLANWSFKPSALSPLYQSNLAMLADLSIGEVISVFFKKPSHLCPVLITTAYHAPRILEQLSLNEHKYTPKSALVALSAVYLIVSNFWEPMKARMNASPASFDIQKSLMELLQALDRVVFRFYLQALSYNKEAPASTLSPKSTQYSATHNGTLRGETITSPSKEETYISNLNALHTLSPASDDTNNTPHGTPPTFNFSSHVRSDSTPANDAKSRKIPKMRIVLQMTRLLIDILYRAPFQCFISPYRCWLIKETQTEFRQMLLFCARKDRQIRVMSLTSLFEAITSPASYGAADKTDTVLDKSETEKSVFLLYFWFCDLTTCSNEMSLDMSMLGKMELVGLLCLAAADSKCRLAGLSLLRHLRLAETDKATLQQLLENHTASLLNSAMARLARREPDAHQKLQHFATADLWERFKADQMLWYFFLAELCKSYSMEDNLLGCATTLGNANFDALHVVINLFEYYSAEANHAYQASSPQSTSPVNTLRGADLTSLFNSERYASLVSSYVAGYLLILFALPHERQVDFVGKVLQSPHFHTSLVNPSTCKWAIFAVQSATFHALPIFVEYALSTLAHNPHSGLDRGDKSFAQNAHTMNPYHAVVCTSILGELVHAHVDRFETFTIEERTDKANPKQRRFTRLQRLVDQLSQLMSLNLKILSSEEGALSSLNLTLRTYCFSQAVQLIIALALVQAKTYDVSRAHTEEMVQEILGAKLVWISKADKMSTIQFLQVELFNHNVACCTYLNQAEAGSGASAFKPVFLKHQRSSVSSGSKNALYRSASNGSSQHQHINSNGSPDLANSSSGDMSRQHSTVVSPNGSFTALNINRADGTTSPQRANGHAKASSSSAAAAAHAPSRIERPVANGDVSSPKYATDRPKSGWASAATHGSILSPAAQSPSSTLLAPPSYSVQSIPMNGPNIPQSPGSTPIKSMKGSKSRTPQPLSISVLDSLAKPLFVGLEELSGLTLIAWETLAQIGLLNAMELPLFSSSTPMLSTHTSYDPPRSRSVSGSSASVAREKVVYSTPSTSTNDRDPYDPSFQFTPRGTHVHSGKESRDRAAAPATMHKLLGLDKMRFSLLKWLLHYQRRDYKVTYESLFNLMLNSPEHRKNYIFAIAANVVALPEAFSPLVNNLSDSDGFQDPDLMLATYYSRPMPSATASHLILVPKISSRFFSLPLHMQLIFPCVLLADSDRITRRIARDMLRAIVAQHPDKKLPVSLRSEAGANLISDLEGSALATAGEVAEMFSSEVPLMLIDCLEKIPFSSPLEQSWLAHLVISFGIHVTPLTVNILHALYDATKTIDSRLDATFGRVWGSLVHTVRPSWREDLKLVVHFLINDVSSNRSSVSKILLAIYEVSDEHALRITSILLGVLESKSIVQLSPPSANSGDTVGATISSVFGAPGPSDHGSNHFSPDTPPRNPRRPAGDAPAGPQANVPSPSTLNPTGIHYTTASLDTQQTIEALVTIIDSNIDRLLKTAPRLVFYSFLNFRDSAFSSLLATILERASLAQEIAVPIRVDMCYTAALLRGNVLATAAARATPTSAFSSQFSSDLPPNKRRSHHYHSNPSSTLQPLYGGTHSQSSANSMPSSSPSHSALNSARGNTSAGNRKNSIPDPTYDFHGLETTYDDPKDWTFGTYILKLIGWLRLWDVHFASRFFDVVCEYVGKCANKDIVNNHVNLATALQIYRAMLDDVTWPSKSEDVSDQTAPLLILITDLVTIVELEHNGTLLSESCLSFNSENPLALEKSRYHESLELSETLASFTRCIFSSSSPHTFWALVALLHSKDRNLFSYAIRAFWMLRFHTLVLIDGPKFDLIPTKYWHGKGIVFTCAVDRLLEALDSDDIAAEEPNILALALTLARSDLKLISGGKDCTLLLLFVAFIAFFWNSVRTPSSATRFVCHSFSSLLLHLQQKHSQLSARGKTGGQHTKTEKLIIPGFGGGGSENSPYKPLVDKSPRGQTKAKREPRGQSKNKTDKQMQTLLNELHSSFDRYVARPTQSRLTALVECISDIFLPAESQLLTDALCKKLRARPAQAPALLVLARTFLEMAPTTEHFPKLIATAFELSMDSRYSGISFELQRLVEVAPLVSVTPPPLVAQASESPMGTPSKTRKGPKGSSGSPSTPKSKKGATAATSSATSGSPSLTPSTKARASPVPPIPQLVSKSPSSLGDNSIPLFPSTSAVIELPPPKTKSSLASTSMKSPGSPKIVKPPGRSPSGSPALESKISHAAASPPTKIDLSRITSSTPPPSNIKTEKSKKNLKTSFSIAPPLSPSSYKVAKRQSSALEDHVLGFSGVRVPSFQMRQNAKVSSNGALSDSESESDSESTWHCMATHMLERVLDALEGEAKKLRNDLRSRANSVATVASPRNGGMSPVASLNLGLLRQSSDERDGERAASPAPHTPLTPYQPLPTVHTDDDAASELEVATFMAKQKKKTFFRRTVANNRPILDTFVAEGAWPSSTGSGMLGSSEDSEEGTRLEDSALLSPITHRSSTPPNNLALVLPYNTNYNPKSEQTEVNGDNLRPSTEISNTAASSRLQPNVYRLVRIEQPLRLEMDQAAVLQMCNDHLAGDEIAFKSMRELRFSTLRELYPHISSNFGHLPSILKLLFNLNEISEATLRMLQEEEPLKNPGIFAIVSLSSPSIYLIYVPPKDVTPEFEENARRMCYKLLIEAGKSHFFFSTEAEALRLQSLGVADPRADSNIDDDLTSNKTSETPTAGLERFDSGVLSRRASMTSLHSATTPQPTHGMQHSRTSLTPLNVASTSASTMNLKLARPLDTPHVSSAFQIALPSSRPHASTPILATGASNLLVLPEKVQQNTKLDMSSLIFGPDAFENTAKSTSPKPERKLATPSKSGTRSGAEKSPSKMPMSPVSSATGAAVFMQGSLAGFVDGWIANGGRVKLFPDFVNDATQMIDFFRRYSAQVDAEMLKVEEQLDLEVQSLETDSRSSILAMIEYFLKTVCPIEYRVVHQFTSPGSTDAFDEVREAQVAFFQNQLLNSVESSALTDSRRKYYEALYIINAKERKLVAKGKPRLGSAQKAEFIERLLLSPRSYKRALSKISDKAPLTLFVNENLGNEFLPIVTAEIQDFIIANYNAVLSNAVTTFVASHRDTFVIWAKQHYEIDARQKLFDLLVPAYNQLITSNPVDNIKNNRRFSSSSNPEPVSARAQSKMPNPLVLTIYRFMPVVSATTSSRPSKRKEQGAIHKQPASPSSTLTQRRTKTESKTLKLASPRSASQSFELTFVEEKIEGSPRLLYSSYHIAVGESETAGKLVEARSKPFWTFTHSEQLLSVLTLKDGSVYSFVYDKKANETVVYVGYSKDMVARKSEASRFDGLCTHIVLSPRQKLIALTIGNSIRVLSVDATFVPIFEFEVTDSETHILDIRFAGSSRLVVFLTQAGQTYFQVYFMELVTAIKAQNSHNSKAQKGPRVYVPPSNGRLITPNGQYLILLDDMLCAQVYDLSLWLKPPNFAQDELSFTPSSGTKSDIAPLLNVSTSAAHSNHSDMHSDESSNGEKGDHHFLSASAFTLMLAPKFHSFVLPSRVTLLTVAGQLYLVGLTDEVLEFLTLQNLPGLGTTARSMSHTPALAPNNEILRASLAQSGRSTSSLPVTTGRPKERSNLDSQIWCILDLFAEVKGCQAEASANLKASLSVSGGGGNSRISELTSSVSTATTTGSTELVVNGLATENVLHFVVNGLDTNGMARHSLRQLFRSVVTASPVLPRSFSFFVSAQASLELLKAPLVLRFTHKQAPAAPNLGKWLSDLACATSPQVVSADAGSFTLKALSITSTTPPEDPDQPKKSARRRHANENDFSAFSAISGLHALLNDWHGPVKIISIVGTEQRYETMAQTFRQVSSRFARLLAQSVRLSTGVHALTFEQEDGKCLWVVLDAVWPGDVIGATHFERQILLFLCAVSSVVLWHSSHADSISTISQLLELMDLVSEQAAQFKTNFDAVLPSDAFMPALFQGKLYVLLSDVVASSQAANVATEFKESFRKVKKSKRRGADFCARLFGSNLPSLFLYPDTNAATYKSSIDTLRSVIGVLPPTAPSGAISAATLVLALETASQLVPSNPSSANATPNRTMHREKKVSPSALHSENSDPANKMSVTKVEMPPIDALLTNLEHAMRHGVENDGHQLSVGYGPSIKLIDDPVVQIGGLVLHDSNFDMYSEQSITRIVDALKDANVPKTELHYEFAGLLSYLVNRRLSRMATWMDECLKTDKSENSDAPSTPVSDLRASQMMMKSGEIGRSVDEDEDKPIAKRTTGGEKDVELDVSSKSSPTSGNEADESKDITHEEDSTTRMLKSRKHDHEGDPKFEILVQSFETLRDQLRRRWEICNVKCGTCSLMCSIPRYFHEKIEVEDDEDDVIEIQSNVSRKPSRSATLRPEQSSELKKSSKRSSTPTTSRRRRNSEKSQADRKIDLRAAGKAGVEGASQKYHELYLKHDCGTDHACSEPCHKCGVHSCRFPFGHGKSDDDYQVMHECGEKHPCSHPCRFAAFKLRGCAGICGLDEKHPSVLQPHDCGQPHQCNQYCAFCDQYCKHLFTVPHRTHACAETECKHSCQIHHHCSRPCTLGHQHTEKHYCGVNESNIVSSSTSTSNPK